MATTLTTSYQRISTINVTYGQIRTYAKYNSQSTANNTTTISLKTTYYLSQWIEVSRGTSTLDGNSKSYGYTRFNAGETTLQEFTRTINHNADGTSPTKNVATSWSASYGGGGSTSASVVAPKILRQATITSAPDFNDEANPTIKYSNPAGNSVNTLMACITTASDGTIRVPYRDISKTGTSYTFNLTDAERNTLRSQTPNSNTLAVKFFVRTVIGSTTLYSSVQKTMTIVNGNPTFTHSEVETNSVVSDALGSTSANTIVQNLSNVKVTVVPSAKKSSTIKQVQVTHSGTTYTDTTSPYEFNIKPLTNSLDIKVTDSRGNTASQTATKTMLNYAPVKINSFSFKRRNPTSSDIIINLDATYWNTNIGDVTNAPVVQWKMGSEGTLTTIPSSSVTVDNTNHKITVSNYTLSNQLVYTSGETFYIYVSDAFSSTSNSMNVTKGIPVFDLGDNEAQVNGDLYVGNTSGSDVINVLEKLQSPARADVTDANITHKYENNKAHMQFMIATSSMTSNKPAGDGYIIHCGWDNSGQYVGQLFIPNQTTNNRPLQFRACTNGTWGTWENIYREKVLYSNASGTTGTITLNENYTNFTYLEIFYGNPAKTLMSSSKIKIGTASGIEASVYTRDGTNLYFNSGRWTLTSPNKLTAGTMGSSIIGNGGTSIGSSASVYIYEVIGYR